MLISSFRVRFKRRFMSYTELADKKFSILEEMSSATAQKYDVHALAYIILDLAINYADAEKASLMILNGHGYLHVLAALGSDIHPMKKYRVKIGEGIAGIVAQKQVSFLVGDIEKDKRFNKRGRDIYNTKSFISCPVVSNRRLVGVLNVADKKNGKAFSKDDFALLKIIARQTAVALDNAVRMSRLRAKAAELERIGERLRDNDILRAEFLNSISYKLRTPLNSIRGAIHYLQQTEKPVTGRQKEFYDIISSETAKLLEATENLLNFLRAEDEMQISNETIISLPELLKEILASLSLRSSLERKNFRLGLDVKGDISHIVGDKVRITQFFLNLMEGLGYYLERGDSIAITVNEDDFIRVNISLSRRLPAVVAALFDARSELEASQTREKLRLYLAGNVAAIRRWGLSAKNTDKAFVLSLVIPKSEREKQDIATRSTVRLFLELVARLLRFDICSAMLSDEVTGELTIASAIGLDDEIISKTRVRIGDRIAGWVALKGKPLLIENIEKDLSFGKENIARYNTKSLLSVPLKVRDRVIGVINLNNKRTGEPLTMRDFYAASMWCERISYVIEKLNGDGHTDDNFKNMVASLEHLIEIQRKYDKKDSLFPELMVKVISKLRGNEQDKKIAIYISMIYDLGLVTIDHGLLKKKLLPPEQRAIKIHPYTTIDLIDGFEFSEEVREAILHHHERYDGTGYPRGLKNDDIPFISRVLSVVDAYCSMIAERPYRKALTKKNALRQIRSGSGSAYDPKVATALESCLA
jgi:HD-GYP domain-containing protein (c-di-GMP phosphodiesterase class II)